MATTRDYYEILGLSKDASVEDIKKRHTGSLPCSTILTGIRSLGLKKNSKKYPRLTPFFQIQRKGLSTTASDMRESIINTVQKTFSGARTLAGSETFLKCFSEAAEEEVPWLPGEGRTSSMTFM